MPGPASEFPTPPTPLTSECYTNAQNFGVLRSIKTLAAWLQLLGSVFLIKLFKNSKIHLYVWWRGEGVEGLVWGRRYMRMSTQWSLLHQLCPPVLHGPSASDPSQQTPETVCPGRTLTRAQSTTWSGQLTAHWSSPLSMNQVGIHWWLVGIGRWTIVAGFSPAAWDGFASAGQNWTPPPPPQPLSVWPPPPLPLSVWPPHPPPPPPALGISLVPWCWTCIYSIRAMWRVPIE